MKLKRIGFYVKAALMALCVVGGAFIHILYERFVNSTLVSALLLNALALAALYIYLHLHYAARRVAVSRKVLEALENVKVGRPTADCDGSEEYAQLLETVADFANFINERERTRSDILTLLNSVASNMELESMLNALLPKIISTSSSSWGAFYLANETTGKLEIKASFGFSKNIYSEFDVNIGEGLVGMAALSREIQVITELPDDSIFVTRTFLGKIKPKSVMAVPVMKVGDLVGVLALASIGGFSPAQRATVSIIQEYIGAAVANSVAFEHSKRLMGELRFQNNLIRDLYDEMENKASDAAAKMEITAKTVSELFARALGGEFVLIDVRGGALFGTPSAALTLTGTDAPIAGSDVFGMFAEPERIAAFAHAGQGTERFRLSVGSFVTISAFASKNEDTVQFVALRIDAG